MAISANYAVPVYVNGYACDNCAEVAEAKRDIDPAHPQSGPGGIDAQFDPTARNAPAVILGGALAGAASNGAPRPQAPTGPGGLLDISA
jgi:hypothetical protein